MLYRVNMLPLLVSLAYAANAYSLETVSGEVTQVQINSPSASKRNLIVKLQDPTTKSIKIMCSLSSNNDTGYINKSDTPDTYEAFIATILTAKSTKSSVSVLTSIGSEGCKIERVTLE